MGYWENTVYVRSSNVRLLSETIERLFADEGMLLVDPPTPRTPGRYDSMQYGTSDQNELWAVAVLPGAAGWSLIKTAPFELLIERRNPHTPIRLGQLCEKMRADGFQFNIYDSSQQLLVEASRLGEVRLSGFCENCPGILLDSKYETATYNGQPLILGADEFGLIDPGAEIKDAISAGEETLGRVLAPNGAYSNFIQVVSLIPHRPITIPGTIVQYFRRAPARSTPHRPRRAADRLHRKTRPE